MFIRETKMVEKECVKDILCNKCEKSTIIDSHGFYEGTRLESDFGYGSVKDGDREEFHLCDDCYKALTGSFKIEPTKLASIESFF